MGSDIVLMPVSLDDLKKEILDEVKTANKQLVEIFLPSFLKGNSEEEVYDLKGASDFLNLADDTTRDYANAGEIAFSQPGRKMLFLKSDLLDFLNRHRKKSISEIKDEANNYINK